MIEGANRHIHDDAGILAVRICDKGRSGPAVLDVGSKIPFWYGVTSITNQGTQFAQDLFLSTPGPRLA
jgi:hypothetical protein